MITFKQKLEEKNKLNLDSIEKSKDNESQDSKKATSLVPE